MDSVNNNGSNKLFGAFQLGTRAVGEVIKTAGKVVLEKLPSIPLDYTSLMHNMKPLVQALVQPDDGLERTFPELPIVPVGDMFERWSPEYVKFIRTHYMKRLEECVGDGVIAIEDSDRVFVARSEIVPDISVEQARNFGLILPNDIDERVRCNPNLKIKPLVIRCFGVGSGNILDQIHEGAKNILSSSIDRLASANALVLSHIESERKKFESDPNVLVVPIITGFSMGGMFASAIAVKNNFSSMVLNGLGLGRSGCEFVGREAWARAQRQPNSHIAVSVQSDFVASPDSPLPDVTRTPGRIVLIPNDNPKSIGEMHRIHFYREIFDKAYRDHITSHPRANGRLVA